jgi:hypothetical protein
MGRRFQSSLPAVEDARRAGELDEGGRAPTQRRAIRESPLRGYGADILKAPSSEAILGPDFVPLSPG